MIYPLNGLHIMPHSSQNFPTKSCRPISLAVRTAVRQALGKSRLLVIVSIIPNGNMDGIQPDRKRSTSVSHHADISTPKKPHKLTLRQLQRPSLHGIMAGRAARQVVRLARLVDRGLELSEQVALLMAREDREVVVCEVQAGVALGAERGAVEDQVLGDGGVEDDEGAHCAAVVAIRRCELARVRVPTISHSSIPRQSQNKAYLQTHWLSSVVNGAICCSPYFSRIEPLRSCRRAVTLFGWRAIEAWESSRSSSMSKMKNRGRILSTW